MSKNNGKPEKFGYNIPEPQRKQTFAEMFYDPRDGSILGRTTKSWGQLFLFYLIFYIILGLLFAVCMSGLLSSIDKMQPKWQLEQSLIGTNPGLGFRPLSEETERGSVIKINANHGYQPKYWITSINEFLKPYNPPNGTPSKHCDYQQTPSNNDACLVNLTAFGPCTLEKGYGYTTGEPCIFLKLNKIFGWIPEVYSEAVSTLPQDVQDIINQTADNKREQIWVTCNGHYGKDKERYQNVTFHPSQGFPAYYYPYRQQPGYVSPLVAVKINDPPKGEMLDIECRAWAKNIIYNGSLRDRMGSVTFQILVD